MAVAPADALFSAAAPRRWSTGRLLISGSGLSGSLLLDDLGLGHSLLLLVGLLQINVEMTS